ncbi:MULTISPECIES: DUF819 domain-containing protein [Emticicia]|uniref:DUF819 family protein n=1 Tax=Emticicia TaxID=312278 RepID=UPI0007D89EEF|nr:MULTISPECIES: DUF819 family protein [Emticicia]
MFTDSLSILAVLCLNIVISEWVCQKPFFRHVGTGLMVIILTAIIANLGIIPASTPATPLYEGIFTYIAPLSIFLMLLGVNLNSLKKAGRPMLIMFLIGSVATMIGAVVAMTLVSGKTKIGELFYAIGGMYTGTYIGGSINFNAVALHYGVSQQGGLFSAATVADNIISAIWVIATLVFPMILNKKFPRKKLMEVNEETQNATQHYSSDIESVRPFDLAFLLAISFMGIRVSAWLSTQVPQIPTVIWLTTIALLLAQIPAINKLKGHKLMGLLGVYLFLAVIGAYCDVPALLKDGELAMVLLLFVSILAIVHGIIIYGLGALLKQDWDIISIASQANVGGSASAMALSRSLDRTDLTLPGILVGALGNATGTYWGILIAELMRNSSIF